ncbi:Protein farnesyltransferase/geranylgeranyltransferase type-1 subunit alpha [Ceratocystis platani]|uniref:Protein farnesyltransferase/geranylgeranyltransferase type-1 subunit alpha n=1 Tax=Ceratocystis fimbriata f. sp. platani TaxID=88771 RepID=A0A0F8B3J0_CERFI|nr:Protein farnesyltransferase/geranylgeranyltransferase type-1 subunit alpha [Ceratocystis platani]
MAGLNENLYGQQKITFSDDPIWEDVPPIPAEEPEGSLAAIAFPPKYAEATAYLRIVMASNELSERAFRLTAHIISMNPAHYTVWLYRFRIMEGLKLPFDDEIKWLNEVSLEHLKNYQIWHHRQLLMDKHYPTIADDKAQVNILARSETKFITQMLEADAKNYHVWSYRQWLVRRIGMWNIQELCATQNYIEQDLRNNSAWSHRFFLVFSDPMASSGAAIHATEADPEVPHAIIERELAYAREKIDLAPQNQSPWNYLKGVLVKGGRGIETEKAFVEKFVRNIGEGDEEAVLSTHALDFLAEILVAEGEKERAAVCLSRLSEKWDPVRAGYWKLRQQQLAF